VDYFLQVFLPNLCMDSSFPWMLHALLISPSFNLIILTCVKEYKLWSFTICNFLQPVIIHPCWVLMFSSGPSNTPSLCSSLNVRAQVSHTTQLQEKYEVLYILLFTFLDSMQEDKRFWTEWPQVLPECYVLSTSLRMQFWYVTSEYLYV
jgi:hypothetical protein